jgi:hypothetical protein
LTVPDLELSYVYPFEVVTIAIATLGPAYLALYAIPNLKFIKTQYIAALGLGLAIWFFFDTMGDANEIDVNNALYPVSYFGGWYHIALITCFAFGIVMLAVFDHLASIKNVESIQEVKVADAANGSRDLRYLIFVPIAIAAVMGIHGFAEGFSYGATVAFVPGSPAPLQLLLDAFSPGIALPEAYAPLISYPLHKLLEASIIACAYTVFIQRNDMVPKARWHLPVLGLLFGGTSIVGSAIGYFDPVADITFFYAFGVTSALYAFIRLGEGWAKGKKYGGVFPGYLDMKAFIFLGLGFFLLYFAALLH